MSVLSRLRDTSVSETLVIGGCLVATYIAFIALYRLYFHPLAKFPGPFWARLTGFPSWWQTRLGERHIWLWRLQEEYGPMFRCEPNQLIVNTATGFRQIYGTKGNVKKAGFYEIWPRVAESRNTWNLTDPDAHARNRRVLNYAFSEKALRSAEPFIHSNTDRWCELIEQEIADDGWSGPLNMADWSNYLVFDILGDLSFGKSFEMKEPKSNMRYVIALMAGWLEIFHPIAHSPVVSLWAWAKPRGLDLILKHTMPPAASDFQVFVAECLDARTKKEEKLNLEKAANPDADTRKDFFHYLFGAVDPETGKLGYSLEELFAECELLIVAGSDTTSTVLAAMLFYLCRNPEVQSKLADELSSTFADLGEIKGGIKLTSCRYLRAFVQESLRMCPPVAADLPRVVLEGGTVVDGHFLPEGVRVATGIYCISYNEEVYPEPFRFRPERWLVDEKGVQGDPADMVALAESGVAAFSTGTRGCIGKNLAWLEMTIVMAKFVYMFEVARVPGDNTGAGSPDGAVGRQTVGQYQTRDVFVAERDGPLIQVRRRVHN